MQSWVAYKEKDFPLNLAFLCVYLHAHTWSESRESASENKKKPQTFYMSIMMQRNKKLFSWNYWKQIPGAVSIQISAFLCTTKRTDCFPLLKTEVFSTKSPSSSPLLLTLSLLGDRSITAFPVTLSRVKPFLWHQPRKIFKATHQKKKKRSLWNSARSI